MALKKHQKKAGRSFEGMFLEGKPLASRSKKGLHAKILHVALQYFRDVQRLSALHTNDGTYE